MSAKDKGAAARAKKKHEKEKKRADAQAARKREVTSKLTRREEDPVLGWKALEEGLDGLAARGKVSGFEAAQMAAEVVRAGAALPDALWTLGRVRMLKTEELVARLGRLGLATTRESLRAELGDAWSAWDAAAAAWMPRLGVSATALDRDFVRLAAGELRTRWFPELPSRERTLEAYLGGIDASAKDDARGEIEQGLVFLAGLRPMLGPDVRDADAVDALLGLVDSFAGWVTDFCETTAKDAVEDRNPELASRVADALGGVIDHLTEEDALWRTLTTVERARLLAIGGRLGEGERVLRGLIDAEPRMGAPYLLLAMMLSEEGARDLPALHRAIGVLEEGIAKASDAKKWELGRKAAMLRQVVARLEEEAEEGG